MTTNVVADLYIVLYDSVVSNPATGHGRAGFYFGENGEYTLYEVSKAISEAMLALGKGKTLEPTPFTEEEYEREPNVSKRSLLEAQWTEISLLLCSSYTLVPIRAAAEIALVPLDGNLSKQPRTC